MNDGSGTPTAIELLILSSSMDESEQITTSLRNGGLAVHSTRCASSEDLESRLLRALFDMVLCCSHDERIDLQRTLDTLNESEQDLPLLVMADTQVDPSGLLQAMREGARDIVERQDWEHLQLVVAREFSNLQQRRELARVKQRLQEAEQRCLGLIESSREPIAFIQDGMHVHVNPAYLDIFGFDNPADIEDLPLLDTIDKEHRKELRAVMKKLETDPERRSASLNTVCRRQDGSLAEATLYLSKASMEGEPCLQVILRDKDQSAQEIEAKFRRLNRLDTDTQLPNRQYFLSQLDHWLDTAMEDTELRALMYLSVDNFPALRSTLGMSRSNDLVREIADLLRSQVDQQDLLARFSDHAFTLLCRAASADDIEILGETLRASVGSARYVNADTDSRPSCSIGIVLLGTRHAEANDLINKAFNASETARQLGGSRTVMVHRHSVSPQSEVHDSRIIEQIDGALSRNRFRLAYQPIISLQGDTRESYAVLIRMLDETDQELLPEFFLRQAAQGGKLVEIDRWVIRRAIASLSEQRREGRKVNFFVTLSDATLGDKNILLWICDCLREFDARGGWLTFQIREKQAREQLAVVGKLVKGLKKIKCQIALDHFGLLPNPEQVLQRLPVDFVKLAPSFVRDIHRNQQKQDELNSLNERVTGLGVKTIATAVENASSLTVLWTIGVGYLQGYFLQEPSETIDYQTQELT